MDKKEARQRKPDNQSWESWIEDKIREAQNAGLFDDLPGAGKPLPDRRNPFLPESKQLAYDLLKDSGHTLPWIEEGKTLDKRIARARQALRRQYARYLAAKAEQDEEMLAALAVDWAQRRQDFEQEVIEINRLIDLYNLKVPTSPLQKYRLVLKEEYDHLYAEND